MKILVTGGSGFLGSHLCEQLPAEGQQVICLDNFFTGRRHNILPLLDHPRFKLLHRDVCGMATASNGEAEGALNRSDGIKKRSVGLQPAELLLRFIEERR